MAKGFRIGWPEYRDAWRVLDFEYTDLDNEHILDDLANFLRVRGDWSTVLGEFRRRYPDAQGVWLCPTIRDAVTYYGKYYGEGAVIEEWEYDPRNIISDLGDDGLFALNAVFVRERGVDPLEPLKRDLARIFRWPRRR
ncbi:hypothetical protein ES703_30240 [subsurface metagenome]